MSAFILPQQTMFSKPEGGLVEKTITPNGKGRVKYQASYWPAQFYNAGCQATAHPDTQVTVVGRLGIVLLVVPEMYEASGSPNLAVC
ncbi:MAG: hypothetical protein F6K19_15490 [Cyanothece sp. SIO1E1]|nr:hypothetical protein [Cyanothece sp. SIO1E1]